MARLLTTLFLLLALLPAGCGPSDPKQRVLAERARWNVTPLSWAMDDQGRITLSARVSGPTRSKIQKLTVRIELIGPGGAAAGQEWSTLDLSDIRRGGPQDVLIRLPARKELIEELTINRVLQPTAEETPHIEELQL